MRPNPPGLGRICVFSAGQITGLTRIARVYNS
jgi:hypothetical protein